MFFSFIRGILGNYFGVQRSKEISPIVEDLNQATIENELQIPAAYQCISLIVNTLKSLPVDVLKVSESGQKTLDKNHELYKLLNYKPNTEMTPSDFKAVMCLNYLLSGNAYARINKSAGGNFILSLYPLNAEQIETIKEKGRIVYYKYLTPSGDIEKIPADEMIHWKNMGNGLIGLSLKDFARTTLSEGIYAQNSAIDVFRNKGQLKGILISENYMDKGQAKIFQENFQNLKTTQSGIKIIPSAFRYQQLSLSPAETQLLETRKYNAEDWCKWFGVPVGLITGSGNLEENLRLFYKTCMLPLCTSFEEVFLKALPEEDWSNYEIKCQLSKVNRASDSERAVLNSTYVQNGIKTRNEVRREEGLKDMEGGDILTAQTNLAPVNQLGVENYDPSQTSQTTLTNQPEKQ